MWTKFLICLTTGVMQAYTVSLCIVCKFNISVKKTYDFALYYKNRTQHIGLVQNRL